MVPASELQAGRVIGGRYRIESLLGSGGMGVLYVAEHLFTHRKVALKLLHPSHDSDREQLHARFLSEARTASAVRHPHVVDVLDMGTDEEGQPFLVMELLEGRSLDRLLIGEQRLSPESAIAWTLPIASALAALHDAGIVHRDVKPSNIFLCRTLHGRTEPKLLDFGLARAVSDLRLTRSGVVIGTPLYMAPEHAAGEAVGPQADVWSLGVVLYECLAGETPYLSRDGAAIAAQVLAGHVRPLHQARPELPQPLAIAVERALRRDLTHRYRNMRELMQGLIAGARASGIPVTIAPEDLSLPGGVSAGMDVSSAPTLEQQTPPSKSSVRKRAKPAGVGKRKMWPLWLGLAALLASGVVWWWSRLPAQTEAVEQPTGDAPPPSARKEPLPVVVPLSVEEQPRAPEDKPTKPSEAVAPVTPAPERSTPEPAKKPKRRRGNNEVREERQQLDVETEWK